MKLKIINMCILILLFTAQRISSQESLVLSSFPAEHPITRIGEPIIQAAYKKIGIAVVIQHYPIARAIELANDGDTDGELCRGAGIKENFPNLVMVPTPIATVDIIVFTKNLEFPVEGWECLRPYRIGLQRGFRLGEVNTKGMTTYPVEIEQAFYMLDAGRVDVVVAPRLTGLNVLNNLNLTGIKILTPRLQQDVLYHFLHKKHQHLVPKLAKILEEMKKSGEIDRIRKKAEEGIKRP